MDVNELFSACRRGDLAKLQYLVEQKEADLNIRDKWDSTPLYYACLCGHEEVVAYMLENGAKCEAQTFDGERCLYGALSNDIRNLLKNYKAITASTIRRNLFNEFLRRALERETFQDISFVIQGETIKAHRCILSARSQYFAELLMTKWRDREVVNISHRLVTPWAFKVMLQFLYTGCLEAHVDQLEEIFLLAKYCHLDNMTSQLEERSKKVESFESTKPGVSITMICLEPSADSSELQSDLSTLADQALPQDFLNEADVELPFPLARSETFSDVVFCVDGQFFQCHKVFFCSRSDYFKARIEDHFEECLTAEGEARPIIPLRDISASVFLHIVYYIYQDSCELTEHSVFDVLLCADRCLLPGLKRQCANFIGKCIDTDNALSVLRAARLFSLPRLEDQCAEFLASNLEKMLHNEEFADFVREDATSLKEREMTDSIPVIDDVRFYITSFVQTFSDMYEAEQKLALIDAFLEELGLDA